MDKEQLESKSLHGRNFFVHELHDLEPRNVFEGRNDDPDEEIELTLGLSLNGKFGLDPKPKARKLKRTSSIPEFVDPSRLEEKAGVVRMSGLGGPLVRTCSLPTEAEEEVQVLRRMEAKRKRNEKQRNLKLSRERSCEVTINGGDGNLLQRQCLRQGSGLPNFVKAAIGGYGNGNGVDGKPPLAPPPLSQGSIGSQGSGSSGITESESRSRRGVNKQAKARSPASIQSLPESEQKPAMACGNSVDNLCKFVENAMDNTSSDNKSDKESIRNVLRTMPCLSTKGDGPNGKRINGFLWRYKKGEDVMIVCVCHGSILTPAEFVKHAGGAYITHPLRHIVVNPSPLL